MLAYDPIPWLMAQEGLPAVRARRLLGLDRAGDVEAIQALERQLADEQRADGSFEGSPMRTAGVLNLLDDLGRAHSALSAAGASYLFSALKSQPGYERARGVEPGSLTEPCDLCGFFGPYEDRGLSEVMAHGAKEMNAYREYEPLLGPKSPVRGVRRSSLDRAGPASCYSWGLIPLSYIIEALCHTGYAHDERLQPAINALLGAQRESGGWCRNLGGHPNCTLYAVRALGAHPELRQSVYAEKVLLFVQRVTLERCWRGTKLFAAIQAIAAFDLPIARDLLCTALAALAPHQRKNGTFGRPNAIERVVAVLVAAKAIA